MSTQTRPPARPASAAAPAARPASRMTLASITKTTRAEPDRIFLYGIEKIGKSTFAANAPDVVFISSENGLAEIQPPPARFPEVRTFRDVLDAVETLTKEEHSYRTLAIDSLDWVAHMLNEEVRLRNNLSTKEFDAYGRGYKIALEDWRKLIVALERLQAARPVEVILIAHAEAKNVDPPDQPAYVRYQPKMGGGGVAAALVKEWAKSVLFARHEYVVKQSEGIGRAKGIATGRRILHTQWTAAYDAGSRHGLPDELPLDYAAYAEARDTGRALRIDTARARIEQLAAQLELTDKGQAWLADRIAKAGENPAALAALANVLQEKVNQKGETTGPVTPSGEAQ